MPFRGYFAVAGEEVANSSRVVSHMTSDGMMACSCDITIPYDDTWTGLEAAVGDGPYVITNAPWYNPARPESAEFAGVWMMDVQGMDSVQMERAITEAICAGGSAGVARDTSQTFTFSAVLVACTNAGARFGLNWLACQLRRANARGGVTLDYWKAHPEDTAATAASLKRVRHGVVLTEPPQVIELSGKGGSARHRQASVLRVEWEMVALNPYAYGTKTVLPVVWTTTGLESITWAHAPNCEDSAAACALPTIYNADCTPPIIPIAPAVIPTCGGCLPLCEIERRTFEIEAMPGSCDSAVVSMRVTNEGDDPLTVIFYWQPCGSTEACDRVYPLQVSGLPSGTTVVADSVTGRPYLDVGGVPHRQVGIVSTPSGAPWRATTLGSGLCWELVAESAPGAEYSVSIELQERDS